MEKKIESYNDVLIVPAVNDFKNNPKDFVHGIYSEQKGVLKNHIRFNRSLINKELQLLSIREDSSYLNGKWFYAGVLHHHFGHFLSECIHRLWYYCENRDSFDGIIYLPVSGFPKVIPKYIEDILSFFSIPLSKIKTIDTLTRVEHVVTATPGSQLGIGPQEWYESKLLNIVNLIGLTDYDNHVSENSHIVLARTNFKFNGRIAGFDYFNNELADIGYDIINQEEYPIKEQLFHILSARKIIFEEGSAIHLLEMLPKEHLKSKKVALIKRRINERHYTCLVSKKFELYMIYDEIEEKYVSGAHVNCMSILKNPESFNNFFLRVFEKNLNKHDMSKFIRFEYLDIIDFNNQKFK